MIFVGLPAKSLQDVEDKLRFVTPVAIVIIVAVPGTLSWVVIGRQMRKLTHVSDAMEEVSHGNLAIRDLEVTSDDEIGTLSKDVNIMKEKLRRLLTSVLDSSEKVAASSQELTANADQTSESITHVAENTVAMAEYASKQTDTVEELQGVVDDMSSKMNELHISAKKMDEAAETSRRPICSRSTPPSKPPERVSTARALRWSPTKFANLPSSRRWRRKISPSSLNRFNPTRKPPSRR